MSTHRLTSFGLVLLLIAVSGSACETATAPPMPIDDEPPPFDGAWIMQLTDRAGQFAMVIEDSKVVTLGRSGMLWDAIGQLVKSGNSVSMQWNVAAEAVFTNGGTDSRTMSFFGDDQGDGSYLGTFRSETFSAPAVFARV